MNKTVTVNIGGIVFHIDENAYEMFRKYLDSIRSHFTSSEGRDEIMQDIEARVAEMFQERTGTGKEVITIQDVEEVTGIMGRPDQFTDEETPRAGAPLPESPRIKRRLFRDPDDKLLGGVCSGIANFFDIDPVWVRLIWALLFFAWGMGFLLYILLWIIVPEAKTATDKLQMKGEAVNISSIERNVKEEMSSMRQRMDNGGNVIRRFFDAMGEVLRFLFRFVGKVIVVFVVLIGLLVGLSFLLGLFGVFGAPWISYPPELTHVFGTRAAFVWAWVGAFLAIGLPFIMLVYAGLRYLLNIKTTNRRINFMALGLWITGLVICVVVGVNVAKQFSVKETVRQQITLLQPAGGTMFLSVRGNEPDESKYDDHGGGFSYSFGSDSVKLRNEVKLDIVKSTSGKFELVQILTARGTTRQEAAENAKRTSYAFNQHDSAIVFDRLLHLAPATKWRDQHLQLVLKVPVGQRVYLSGNMTQVIYDIENVANIWDNDMVNRTWEMTEEGLKCVDCTGEEQSIGGNRIVIGDHGDSVNIGPGRIRVTQDGKEVIRIDRDGVIISDDEKK